MAKENKKPPKQKKAVRGKLPSKQTINLVLVDDNKISPLKAIPAILLIVILAGVFSKFLVADRLLAMSASGSKAARLRSDLDTAMATIDTFGDVETTYAHYTLGGMTQGELGLVDRARILGLVESTLPRTFTLKNLSTFHQKYTELLNQYRAGRDKSIDNVNNQMVKLLREAFPMQYSINSWSVTDNLLTMEVSGNTLRTLNTLAHRIEKAAIVDNCTIITARKERQLELGGLVDARLIVYLQQAEEEPEEENAGEAESEEASTAQADEEASAS